MFRFVLDDQVPSCRRRLPFVENCVNTFWVLEAVENLFSSGIPNLQKILFCVHQRNWKRCLDEF